MEAEKETRIIGDEMSAMIKDLGEEHELMRPAFLGLVSLTREKGEHDFTFSLREFVEKYLTSSKNSDGSADNELLDSLENEILRLVRNRLEIKTQGLGIDMSILDTVMLLQDEPRNVHVVWGGLAADCIKSNYIFDP